MQLQHPSMSPQDVVVLLKIITYGNQPWSQVPLASALCMSQSEVSKSIARSKYAGLLDPTGKVVRRMALMEFLQFGLRYVYPQAPGAVLRGVPTAHSAPPLNQCIQSTECYIWPWGKGKVRGQSIIPLYKSVVDAVQNDSELYEMLALTDALRVGRARERELAISELKKRIINE